MVLHAALGHQHELGLHVRAAIRNGVTAAEIREVLMHTAVYAGVPAANTAFGSPSRSWPTSASSARATGPT